MLGYLNDETATIAAFAPFGWLRTGDVGLVGENGLYYITDRKKDVIKVRGWQVSPAEVEEVLLTHKDLKDAAVVGAKMPEPSTDETVQAYVVLKEGSTLTEAELKAWMLVKIARYKVPEEVYFLDTLPRNPTGKIIRRIVGPHYLEWARRTSEREIVGRLLSRGLHGDGMDTQVVLTPGGAPEKKAFIEAEEDKENAPVEPM